MATYRQVYLIMRARDDASRTMRGLGRSFGHLAQQQEMLSKASSEAQTRYTQAVKSSEAASRSAITAVKSQQQEATRAIKDSERQATNVIRQGHQQRMAFRTEQHRQTITNIRQESQQKMAALRATRDSENAMVRGMLNDTIRQRTAAHQQHLHQMRTETNTHVRELQSRMAGHQANINKMNTRNAIIRENLQLGRYADDQAKQNARNELARNQVVKAQLTERIGLIKRQTEAYRQDSSDRIARAKLTNAEVLRNERAASEQLMQANRARFAQLSAAEQNNLRTRLQTQGQIYARMQQQTQGNLNTRLAANAATHQRLLGLEQTSANRRIGAINAAHTSFIQANAKERDAIQATAKDYQAHYQRIQMVQGAMMGLGQAAILTGGLLGMVGVRTVRSFLGMADAAAEFSQQNRVATSVAKDLQMSVADLGGEVLKIARELPVPIEDLQETFYYTFSALDVGLREASVLVRGFAQEAVVGNANITDAARSTIAMINAYQLDVSDAAKTTEVLTRLQNMQFNTVKWGALTYQDLSKNIGKIIPAATRAGQEIEQIGGALAFATRQGLSAEMAATSVARAMELVADHRVVKRLEDLGVVVRDDVTNEMLQLNEIVVNFGRHLEGLDASAVENMKDLLAPLDPGEAEQYLNLLSRSDEVTKSLSGPERAQALQNIFVGAGNRIQARRFWDMALKNYEELDRLTKNIIEDTESFGQALDMAFKEPQVAMEIFDNRLAALKITIGQEMIPIKLALLAAVTNLIDKWEALDDSTKKSIIRFVTFGAAVAGIGGTITAIVGVFLIATAGLMSFATALLGANATMGATVALASGMAIGIPIAIGLIVSALILLVMHWDKITEAVQRVILWWKNLDGASKIAIGVMLAVAAAVAAANASYIAGLPLISGLITKLGALAGVAKAAITALMGFAAANPVLATVMAVAAAAIIIYRGLTAQTRELAKATKDYADNLYNNRDAIVANSNAIDRLNKEQLINRIEQEGLIEDARRLGLTTKDLTDAIMGEKSALDKVNRAIEENSGWYLLSGPEKAKNITASNNLATAVGRETQAMKDSVSVAMDRMRALGGVHEAVADLVAIQRKGGPQSVAEAEAVARAKDLISASEGLGDILGDLPPDMQEAARAAIEMSEGMGGAAEQADELSESGKLLQSVLQSINNPAAAFQSAIDTMKSSLESMHEQALESGELTRDAFDEIAESALQNSTETAQHWIDALREQEEEHNRFMDNVNTIIARGGRDVVDHVMDMGENSVAAVATMANASDAEFAELESLLTASAKRTSDETVGSMIALQDGMTKAISEGVSQGFADFSLGMRMMEAVADLGGSATQAQIARHMNIAHRDVMRISANFSIDLADNLNPILTGLGQKEIDLHRARTSMNRRKYMAGDAVGGLNEGGQIPGRGPNKDSVLAALTRGEFVTQRPVVDEQGVRNFELLNAGLADIVPRFNVGGRVTGAAGGLNAQFLRQLQMWAGAVGRTYNVTSGWRSSQRQAQLYAAYRAGTGNLAAPPGRSMHEVTSGGRPAALASDGPRWGHLGPGRFGMHYNVRGEPWHVEPVNARAMRGGAPGAGDMAGGWVQLPQVPSFPHNGFYQVAPKALTEARNRAQAWVDANAWAPAFDTGGSDSSGTLQQIAQEMLRARGWASHWPAFNELVRKESSWNPNAQNPTSTAYGLGQFLNKTWALVGGRKTSDPSLQLRYMMDYIAQRYGTPTAALAFHRRNNYYNKGGRVDHAMANGGTITEPVFGIGKSGASYAFGERGPERVQPLNAGGQVTNFSSTTDPMINMIRNAGQVVRIGAETTQTIQEQYGNILNAIQAIQGLADANASLIAARQEVAKLTKDLAGLRSEWVAGVAKMDEARRVGQNIAASQGGLARELGVSSEQWRLAMVSGKTISLETEQSIRNQLASIKGIKAELDAMKAGPTPQQQLSILNAQQNVTDAQLKLANMRKGPGAREELSILQARQRVAELTETLNKMRNPEQDLEAISRAEESVTNALQRVSEARAEVETATATVAQAAAKVGGAQAELMRVERIIPNLDDEVAGLLMLYEAQYNIAEAQTELAKANEALTKSEGTLVDSEAALTQANKDLADARRGNVYTADELRMAELELTLAQEALTEATKAGTYTSRDFQIANLELRIAQDALTEATKAGTVSAEDLRLKEIELLLAEQELQNLRENAFQFMPGFLSVQESQRELLEKIKTAEDNLAGAVKGVTEAEWAQMSATISLMDASRGLYGLQPAALSFFRSIAEGAGISTDAIDRHIVAVRNLNKVNSTLSSNVPSSNTSWAGTDRAILTTGGVSGIRQRVIDIFANRNVPLGLHWNGQTEDPTSRLNRLVNEISMGRLTFDALRASVDRIKAQHNLATGGIVLARSGGTIARIGEGGRDEAVLPLPSNWRRDGIGKTEVKVTIESGAVQVKFEGPVGDGAEDVVKQTVEEALREMMNEVSQDWRSA